MIACTASWTAAASRSWTRDCSRKFMLMSMSRPASARAQATRDGRLRAQQPSRPCLDGRAHMTADFQLGRIPVVSLLAHLIGLVTHSPSLESLASRDVSLSMLQDYTVYTHLAEPLETLLPPARRILAASLGPPPSQTGINAAAVAAPCGRGRKPSGIRAMLQHQQLEVQRVSASSRFLRGWRIAYVRRTVELPRARSLRSCDPVLPRHAWSSVSPRSAAMVCRQLSVIVDDMLLPFPPERLIRRLFAVISARAWPR